MKGGNENIEMLDLNSIEPGAIIAIIDMEMKFNNTTDVYVKEFDIDRKKNYTQTTNDRNDEKFH